MVIPSEVMFVRATSATSERVNSSAGTDSADRFSNAASGGNSSPSRHAMYRSSMRTLAVV
ncbi:hypothetical protein SAMN02745121_00250 [Nannocystis exedens]|uniref:Uncharacterized protein n=1 Tax=Nannocystis exedens TaxID=54 RepID=A0A1I1SSW8_9BACT|nr:hypothetical protein [Nannocystis exedens]PCC75710.1 hypothetical protein NAEX_08823 [Nannocystis exedens]SFD49619.1 hypothetical protein SAMN02745121_00250 [Nannocystis exedens]